VVAQIVYGLVVVAVIIGRPDGVASLLRRRVRVPA
jgi:ABC-type branched-subunit amino acid transport system permease subunit